MNDQGTSGPSTSTTAADDTLPSDPARAAAAFERFLPQALALPQKEHVAPRGVNRSRGALAAIGLYKVASEKELYDLYAIIPAKLFKIAHVDNMEEVAYACIHAITMRAAVESNKSRAKVPVEFVEKSTAHKEKMLTTAEYYFKNHPDVGPELTDIRKGSGYADTMLDLRRLAKVFTDHEKVLKADTMHYLPTDAAVANQFADDFADMLGEGQTEKQKEQKRNELALFALLRISYDEVASTARWLHRNDPHADFPNFIAASRRRVKATTTP